MIAYWALEDLIIADQFRDGKVSLKMHLLLVLKTAISIWPSKIRLIMVRSDIATYVYEWLDWFRKEIPIRLH